MHGVICFLRKAQGLPVSIGANCYQIVIQMCLTGVTGAKDTGFSGHKATN